MLNWCSTTMLVICRTLGCVVVILMRPAEAFCASSYITFSSSEIERLEFKCRLGPSRTESGAGEGQDHGQSE